jgi:catechol 2,3-dioxygenase-like lactoylglutathione lyase family enzyme
MKLTYVRLLVTDFDACFRFYRDVMEWEPTWGQEGDGYADFATGSDCTLALFSRAVTADVVGTSELPADLPTQDRVSLIVGVEDLREAVSGLRERGAQIILEPTDRPDWGIRVAYLRDPDGNLIEVNSPMPQSEWTDELRQEAQANS